MSDQIIDNATKLNAWSPEEAKEHYKNFLNDTIKLISKNHNKREVKKFTKILNIAEELISHVNFIALRENISPELIPILDNMLIAYLVSERGVACYALKIMGEEIK